MSHKSAWKAEKLGYTNVKNFNGGYPAWLKAPGNYGAVTAAYIKSELGKDSAMLIVDSRPRKTGYNKGHVTSAISLPDSKFDAMNGLLPRDKDIPLIFYCGGFT
jgi:rhodanese-related sulfurtransferase